jgi:hypothetical protein
LLPVQAPEAVQEVAFEELQVRVDEPPLTTDAGLAEMLTVGAGGLALTVITADWLALPPAPVQVKV